MLAGPYDTRVNVLTRGTRLGPYQIVQSLGAGGMGEVYRARDSRLGRDVAIKVLPLTLAKDVDRRARFEREARAVASLNHPNIAAIAQAPIVVVHNWFDAAKRQVCRQALSLPLDLRQEPV